MCRCGSVCVVVHALCGVIYTAAGSILIVAGLFFFISSPLLQLGSNILTGGLCIVFGVGSVILTCCGGRELVAPRVDLILGCTLFVLASSVANIIVLEVGEWWLIYDRSNLKEVIEMHQIEELAYYGRIVPSLTTLAVMAVAFLDAQFLYCTYNIHRAPRMRHVHINETVSDIEYIIPRHKTRPMSTKQAGSLSHYTQSWVFDTDASSQAESPYLMLPPSTSSDPPRRHQPASPIISVQVESGSEESPEVGRQLQHMRSFSRTHSPGDASDNSSSTSVSHVPIYECLERLTRPDVYRSRLDTYISESDASTRPSSARADYHRQGAAKQADTETHATLMAELGRSINCKHPNETHSRNSDTDFSQELEAALKLIQDLESPNTIETPSETFRPICGAREERTPGSGSSSKTLSGRSSLNGTGNGKLTTGLAVESLSTSGYNSPSLSDRTTPDAGMACVISHVGPTAHISIFPAPSPPSPSASQVVPAPSPMAEVLALRRLHSRTLSAGDAMKLVLGKMRGMLRGRRPSLAPDLEGAVLKSESLAFLTDGELEDRVRQRRDIHRRIEAKVRHDLSVRRRWESFGSIEDIMDNKGFTQL